MAVSGRIGPTFWDECKTAGVSLDGWSVDTVTGQFIFNDDVPQSVRADIAAVFKAHDPRKAEP